MTARDVEVLLVTAEKALAMTYSDTHTRQCDCALCSLKLQVAMWKAPCDYCGAMRYIHDRLSSSHEFIARAA